MGAHGQAQAEMVGMTGFEPATSCSQSRRATKLRHIPTAIQQQNYTRSYPKHADFARSSLQAFKRDDELGISPMLKRCACRASSFGDASEASQHPFTPINHPAYSLFNHLSAPTDILPAYELHCAMDVEPTKRKGQKHIASDLVIRGAGDGNRTRVISLEG